MGNSIREMSVRKLKEKFKEEYAYTKGGFVSMDALNWLRKAEPELTRRGYKIKNDKAKSTSVIEGG